ncbi:carboxylesterase/lipase family protein [Streptomyces prunicolor]|uniref:Carboxylic ester hydrolase n=1 Tax=Streptomyces prunicolor TaxID=67348 RepID=A0ABU4F261_9ACTN|nr:carboxylesterase family protein [Streptomyces prunicolor]MDV7214677.1 carboxylesterase family protein [Streptomyces prunicolor]
MPGLQVETLMGPVGGAAEGCPVLSWKGIPYAAPPTRERRFRPPAPVKPWAAVRDATRYGPQAVQFTSATGQGVEGEEDCLTLNVWAPAEPAAPRPVLFWIHGGAFLHGSGGLYDGAWLAEVCDAVVVTVNYRLGPLGFLDLEHLGRADTANPALRDLVAALEWVRGNIASFGGDPGRVTLSGQSAGGMLTSTLLAVPAARGLFHQALVLSGAARNVHTPDQNAEVTGRLLTALDTTADRLADVPVRALRDAAARVVATAGDDVLRGDGFCPVVDGTVLPRAPLAAVANGAARHLPVWISHVSHEMDIFLGPPAAPVLAGTDTAGRTALGEQRWAELGKAYASLPEAGRDPHLDLLDDTMWLIPAIRLAEAQQASGGQVWFSRFDHVPGMPPYDRLGATHGADNRCLWAHPPAFNNLAGLPPAPPMRPTDLAVTATLHRAVRAFLHTGAPDWPRYEPKDRATMILDNRSRIAYDPRRERRLLWADLPSDAAP